MLFSDADMMKGYGGGKDIFNINGEFISLFFFIT